MNVQTILSDYVAAVRDENKSKQSKEQSACFAVAVMFLSATVAEPFKMILKDARTMLKSAGISQSPISKAASCVRYFGNRVVLDDKSILDMWSSKDYRLSLTAAYKAYRNSKSKKSLAPCDKLVQAILRYDVEVIEAALEIVRTKIADVREAIQRENEALEAQIAESVAILQTAE